MKLRNPWIDPRIGKVRAEDVLRYLTLHGWKLVGPASDPNLLRYEIMENASAPTLFVPVRADDGPALSWTVELVGELARYEDRWAVDVLNDILSQAAGTAPPDGLGTPVTAEPATK